jgi:hypothetical protein
VLFSCASHKYSTSEVTAILVGTWIEKQSVDKSSFLFVRAEKYEHNIKGMTFEKNGKVNMYFPFGCQTPPSFKTSTSQWKVVGKCYVEIENSHPGQEPERLKIVQINRNKLRFIYD